jgi:hypothetical protein
VAELSARRAGNTGGRGRGELTSSAKPRPCGAGVGGRRRRRWCRRRSRHSPLRPDHTLSFGRPHVPAWPRAPSQATGRRTARAHRTPAPRAMPRRARRARRRVAPATDSMSAQALRSVPSDSLRARCGQRTRARGGGWPRRRCLWPCMTMGRGSSPPCRRNTRRCSSPRAASATARARHYSRRSRWRTALTTAARRACHVLAQAVAYDAGGGGARACPRVSCHCHSARAAYETRRVAAAAGGSHCTTSSPCISTKRTRSDTDHSAGMRQSKLDGHAPKYERPLVAARSNQTDRSHSYHRRHRPWHHSGRPTAHS